MSPRPMKLDAHQHFWRYSPEEYGWIDAPLAALRRDFLPEHLARELAPVGLDGAISVQARQTLEETRWLLALAAENPFIKGVVGWVPLTAANAPEALGAFAAAHPKFRGVRHVLQGEPDERYLTHPEFNAGIRALRPFGLTYDLLIFERQLFSAIAFVDRHPEQVFVLDHVAKPRLRENLREPWAGRLRELARRENVFCKLSGMVTEADWAAWTDAALRPYVETVLAAFGPARVMFGSDWPVCLVASPYARWVETVETFTAELSPDERAQVWGRTAEKAYRLTG